LEQEARIIKLRRMANAVFNFIIEYNFYQLNWVKKTQN